MFKRFFTKKKEVETAEEIASEDKTQFIEEVTPIVNEPIEERTTKEFDPNKIDWLINDSILTFLPRDLYMHYSDSNTKKDQYGPSWQNQGVFFWMNDEPFERKSLPEFFESYERKLFIFDKFPDYIELVSAKAIPWFGMPGEGDKYCLRYEENPINIEEALKLNIIKYVEIIDLNFENLSVLNDRDNYFFLINPEVKFENGLFYLNGKKMALAALYQKKKLKVITFK
ncbi:glycohydrolase toxin TNT-related protein [Flavobacterium sp. Root420]|uniref:glycohydrolase toxin TNT-related protein n=1 Tax=Flavobacterium sp. Root420 TaxID=1736533 RepID=UPI0006F25CD6|nr:glycohydrolase toxin TNT-related protein [Flavobacterium sp. Root420]KQX11547.1 hypothetical protein ASC72_20860 [Flavobacterium sp. Root420]